MKQLKETVYSLMQKSGNIEEIDTIESTDTVFPFSPEGMMLSYLLGNKIISYDEYLCICNEYFARNKYLKLFEMAPRTFGETWGEKHILSLFPQITKATQETLHEKYPNFDGEFDLWYQGIRIEVKACRANSTKSKDSLANRAYTHEEARNQNFKYHYQQLKPSCCDIFIWIGVCRDELLYWVLTSKELLASGKLGSQHRNENTGNNDIPVFEGQVFMTEEELSPFKAEPQNILKLLTNKAKV